MNYLRFLPGVLFLLLSSTLWAEQQPFEYRAGTPLSSFMEHCAFLPDSAYFDQKTPPQEATFIPFSEFDFSQLPNRYWIRFSIRNTESQPVDIQIFVGLSEKLDLYIPFAEGYRQFPIGTFESRKIARQISGPGKTFMAQAAVSLGPGETRTYYAWFHHLSTGVQAERDSKIPPLLIDQDIWTSNIQTSDTIWSLIFGCFIILILYHFVYYFLTRDSVYLYYCLFVFSAAFPFLTLIRDVSDSPEYNALLFFSVSGLFSVFYFQLTRQFISLKTLLPKWDKALKYFILGKTALVVLYSILHLFTQDIFVILATYIPALFIELVLMVLLAIALIKTKDRISLQFVLGSSLAWLGMLTAILSADPGASFTPQVHPYKFGIPAYGFVLESLVFAMVLAYRSKLNEVEKKKAQDALISQLQENKALQEKVNRELEEKVIERTQTIELERQKSENLLLNVLPHSIVEEMKETGSTKPRRFDNVSVLYADFADFTRISANMTPETLVQRLDHFFKNFDAIVARNGMEKIKTIGDAYMCVSGLPDPHEDHARRAVQAALEIQDFLKEYNESLESGQAPWRLRIGVNSGPVVAGVIGDYKFTYDVWGDTVNTASRLEMYSEPGKINISEAVHTLVKEDFNFVERGSVEVKNKGKVRMYFVEGAI